MGPGPITALPSQSSLSLCVTWQGGTLLGHCLCFYWDSTRSSNMFGEITMPPGPGNGHSPAQGFGSCGWEQCWRCWPPWWTIPIRGHCSWMQFKEALEGCSKLTAPAVLGGQWKQKKIMVWSHMFLSCPPSTPQHARHTPPSHSPSFYTENDLAKHGEKTQCIWT